MKKMIKIVILCLCCLLGTELCAFATVSEKVTRKPAKKVNVRRCTKANVRRCVRAKVPEYSGPNKNQLKKKPAKRIRRRKNKDDYSERYRKKKSRDDIALLNPYSDDKYSETNRNHPLLRILQRIHELQKEMLCNQDLSADEREKIRKQIVVLSGPLRSSLGRVKDFPYFSEISYMDSVIAEMVGKKTDFSDTDMSKEDILFKIQQDQYSKFKKYLGRY